MSYHGDIALGNTIDIKFTTRQISGAPATLASSPVISAYVGNGTTELTAGITLSVDFDSRTGLNNVRVVATSGNGYATATDVELVITTGTVNGVSVVGEVIGSFSIENRSALRPATAGRTAVVDGSGLIDANTVKLGPTGAGTAQTARDLGTSVLLSSGTGTGQLDFTSGVVKANLAQILGTALTETAGLLAGGFKKFFNIATPAATMDHGILVDTITTYTGNTPQTGDNFVRLGAPAGASHAADTAAVKADTAAIKLKTDNLSSDPADASDIAALAAAIQADTDNIQTRLPAALTSDGNMKVDVLRINGNATAAAVLAILNGATVVYQGTVTGAATTTTLIDSGLTQADTDWWKGRIIIFTSVIAMQATDITAFDPATDKLTFTACTQAPTGATYVIL